MQSTTPKAIQDELAHGHTRLVWLHDDLDAHLRGLAAEPLDRELLQEEFLLYSGAYCKELRDHIDEEEADVFPVVSVVLSVKEYDELRAIRQQHIDLLTLLSRWEAFVTTFVEARDEARPAAIGALSDLSIELRERLSVHSKDEWSFLARMDKRLRWLALW